MDRDDCHKLITSSLKRTVSANTLIIIFTNKVRHNKKSKEKKDKSHFCTNEIKIKIISKQFLNDIFLNNLNDKSINKISVLLTNKNLKKILLFT